MLVVLKPNLGEFIQQTFIIHVLYVRNMLQGGKMYDGI